MVRERVRGVIAAAFDRAPADLPERLEPETIAGWNSIRHLTIMIALEKEFGIEIDPNYIPALTSDAAIASYVEGLVGDGAVRQDRAA